MSVWVSESEMSFGPFEEERFLHVEKTYLYKGLQNTSRTVEFVYLQDFRRLLFVEAKSSAPKSHKKNWFEEYIQRITDKFIHSMDLFFAVYMGFYADNRSEFPALYYDLDLSTVRIKLVLVIRQYEISGLRAIREELGRHLLRQRLLWDVQIAVLDEKYARLNGLIQ